MDFAQLDKPLLLKIAEEFGVDDVKGTWGVPKIAAELVEVGVTWEMYTRSDLFARENPSDDDDSSDTPSVTNDSSDAVQRAKPLKKDVLIQMQRNNPAFEIRGYRFTTRDPFVLVDEESANVILDIPGFKIASPKVAQEYYS